MRLCWLWLLLLVGCTPVPPHSLDLVAEFQLARPGPILAPSGSLTEPQATPFFEDAFFSPKLRGVTPVRPDFALNFYLDHAQEVELTLIVAAVKALKTELLLNGRPLGDLSLWTDPGPVTYSAQAVAGKNSLTLKAPYGAVWRDFSVRPLREGRSLDATVDLTPRVEGPALLIPFGHSLNYALTLGSRSRLRLDKIEPWMEPGTVPPDRWNLKVRIQDTAGFEKTFELTQGGTTPLGLEGPVSLSLSADSAEKPLPGQLGLKITGVQVEGESPTATPSTAPAEKTSTPAPASKPPNVLIYLVDTLRPDHLGCYGYPAPTSPHLDRLAGEAVVFEQAIAQSPWTKPSTATILSGLHPEEHGVHSFSELLPDRVVVLPEMLKPLGYLSAGFMTNPLTSRQFNYHQGFDSFEDAIQVRALDLNQNSVLPWLRNRDREKPFFLFIHTMDPHMPYEPTEEYRRRFPTRRKEASNKFMFTLSHDGDPQVIKDILGLYDGEIAANDDAFGQVIEELRRQKAYDDTLIVFVSDHGEEFYEHRGFGHLHTLYDELLRVPLVIKFPGGRGGGERVQECWQQLDITPTILRAVGLPVPPGMKGRAFVPGQPSGPPLAAHTQVKAGYDAVETGQLDRPFLAEAESLRVDNRVYVHRQAALIYRSPPREYYDLSTDPGQQHNLAHERPVETLHMECKLRQFKGRFAPRSPAEKLPPEQVTEHLRHLQYLR